MSLPSTLVSDTVNDDLLPVEMPAIQRSVSTNASHFQTIIRRILFAILVFTVIYAFAFPVAQVFVVVVKVAGYKVNLASAIVGVVFLIAFGLHVWRLMDRPERKWYSSRGLSEEIKSFAWRFAVGGQPFSTTQLSPGDAEVALSKILRAFLRQAHKDRLEIPLPSDSSDLPFVTDWMAKARKAPLTDRQTLYAEKRILNQLNYYRDRARRYRRKSRQWSAGTLAVEAVFAIAAAAHAVGFISLDFFGVGATLVAAGTSWVQFNQYRALADLYSDMAFELGEFYRRCLRPAHPWTEDSWAAFVGAVESFLESEHGAWRKLVDPDSQAAMNLSD